jgi:hypothetical protein
MRKGFDGLAASVQVQLAEDPFSGQLFVFRGRRGDRVKLLWWERGWAVFVFEAARTRLVCVAARAKWCRTLESRAVVDAVGGDRLAPPTAHAYVAARGARWCLIYRHLVRASLHSHQ